LFSELSLELLPSATQTMMRQDFSQPVEIDGAGLDELKHARLVFGPTCFQRDGGDVLGCKHASRRSFHIFFDGRRQRFLQKCSAGWKKLDRPAGNHYALTRDLPIARSRHHATYTVYPAASPHAVFTFHQSAGLGVEFNENIDIKSGDRLEVERRSDRAADSVSLNHTVSLHSVDCFDDFFYAHAARISPKRL